MTLPSGHEETKIIKGLEGESFYVMVATYLELLVESGSCPILNISLRKELYIR